jgi:hypothetical protein
MGPVREVRVAGPADTGTSTLMMSSRRSTLEES